jgi:WD repeat and SOF domain-containing protein 1
MFYDISHHAKKNLYATSGDTCLVWEGERNEPLHKFDWGVDSLNCVRFNQSQTNVLGISSVALNFMSLNLRILCVINQS